MGGHATKALEAPRKPLRQDLETLAGEEAHVAPAAVTHHRAEAVERPLSRRGRDLAHLAEVDDEKVPGRRGPWPVDPHVLLAPLPLGLLQRPPQTAQRAPIPGGAQQPQQLAAADPALGRLDLGDDHLPVWVGQLWPPSSRRLRFA